jgi:hypothetical protein
MKMNNQRSFLFTLFALLAAMLACSVQLTDNPAPQSGQPQDVATIVAATVQALTQAAPGANPPPSTGSTLPAPPAPSGMPISFAGTSFSIPEGLASGTNNEVIQRATGQDMAFWEILPTYTKFTLLGYPLQGEFFEPQIMVYPAKDFAALSEPAANTIGNLQTLLANPPNPLPNQIPFLPPFNAGEVFTAQAKVIPFKNGTGLRFLTEFAQSYAPINNHELIYTFQGLTSDGKFYVSAILPVNIGFLAVDANPDSPLPPDGIPLPNYNDPNPNFEGYYATLTQKLNAAAPQSFMPSLESLDTLVESLLVTGQ